MDNFDRLMKEHAKKSAPGAPEMSRQQSFLIAFGILFLFLLILAQWQPLFWLLLIFIFLILFVKAFVEWIG